MHRLVVFALMTACGSAPRAIVDPARAEHFFDEPFPSDAMLDGVRPRLGGFPVADTPLAARVFGGWNTRLELTASGWGNNTAAYFRFDGPLELPTSTPGDPSDPVVWIGPDGELHPLDLRFVADPEGDPYYGANTLAAAPTLGHAPRSGATYVVAVLASSGARSARGWEPDGDMTDALEAAGVTDRVVVATRFTVQDATGQLRALVADTDARGLPDVEVPRARRVLRLAYTQGTTPGGEEATVGTVTYADGSTRAHYQGPIPGAEHTVELDESYPLAVFEVDLPVWYYQGLADRPFMSPGLSHVEDVDLHTGWIHLTGTTVDAEPEIDWMRVVVGLPWDGDTVATDVPVVVYDHGTGGSAYHVVQRRNPADRSVILAEELADAGWGIIGMDAALYGTRYPLIDEGHGESLGFYNIVNLPAFRDNQRQTALESVQLRRWLGEPLNALLPEGSVDGSRARKMGHSLGSVTSNLAMAADPDAWEAALLTGTGGVFTHYFLDTGLLANDIDPALLDSLFPLFGAEPPAEITTTTVLGAALGLDEDAWPHLDRLHPSLMPFQWTMDPSDPMAVARDEHVPITVFIGRGDWQTPDFTAEALAEVLPDATVVNCEPTGSYDPHQCMWREPTGPEALRAWLRQ